MVGGLAAVATRVMRAAEQFLLPQIAKPHAGNGSSVRATVTAEVLRDAKTCVTESGMITGGL